MSPIYFAAESLCQIVLGRVFILADSEPVSKGRVLSVLQCEELFVDKGLDRSYRPFGFRCIFIHNNRKYK